MKNQKMTTYLACAIAEGFCEGEGATAEKQLEAWAYIIKNKLYRGLQGWYGRTCESLIQQGLIDAEGTINWELFNELNAA